MMEELPDATLKVTRSMMRDALERPDLDIELRELFTWILSWPDDSLEITIDDYNS